MTDSRGTDPGSTDTLTEPHTDRHLKRERLRQILAEHGSATTVVLTSFEALSWYFDGARVSIPAGGAPILAVSVDADSETVHCYNNEIDRMLREELASPIENVVTVPWHQPLVSGALAAGTAGVLHETAILPELRAARAQLLPVELRRYRAFAVEVATLFTAVLQDATPTGTERDLARALSERITAIGAEPLVLLVAGQSRLGFRHPLPTDAQLGERSMAVACARRHGMIVNLSRWLRFSAPTRSELDLSVRIAEVEADMFARTVPGASIASIVAAMPQVYARHGFSATEWQLHHQGGPTGYVGRDPRATPSVPDSVKTGQLFTWNPSASGTKIEDTVLLTTDGIEVLTVDPAWPTQNVRGLARPTELLR